MAGLQLIPAEASNAREPGEEVRIPAFGINEWRNFCAVAYLRRNMDICRLRLLTREREPLRGIRDTEQKENSYERRPKWVQGVAWFLAGLGVGALIGILYAPKSGRETREDLAQGAREGSEYLRPAGGRLPNRWVSMSIKARSR